MQNKPATLSRMDRTVRALKTFASQCRARKAWCGVMLLAGVLALACGCKTVSFYAQAARGQYQILALQEPISALLTNSAAPAALRERLALVLRLRTFAEKELLMPVDGHYKKYADLKRPFVVWNVEAAPEFSMEPKSWWYPLVGKLEYRGYFAEPRAREHAAALRKQGYDVQLGGVTAYSTLGWFKDPVLNTFIFDDELLLIDTVFHELAHQGLFVAGDKDFNEAYATSVARTGVRRWLTAVKDASGLARYDAIMQHEDEFAGLVSRTRAQLELLYHDERKTDGKVRRAKPRPHIPPEQLRGEKQRIFGEMRGHYAKLKERSPGGGQGRDWWFERPLNNARLNSVAAYYDLVPGFEQLLELNGGRLKDFYAAAHRLSKMTKSKRHEWLRALMATRANPQGTNSIPEGQTLLPMGEAARQ